jgi:hypothetical protein
LAAAAVVVHLLVLEQVTVLVALLQMVLAQQTRVAVEVVLVIQVEPLHLVVLAVQDV